MAALIHGIHSVQAAIRRGAVTELWVDARRRDGRIGALLREAEQAGVTPRPTDRAELDRLAGAPSHQGVVARVAGAEPRDETYLERLLTETAEPFLLVLDGVQDPHNLGACLRSADAAGVDAVIVPRDRAAGLTATVRKVASGAAESVPLIQVTNLARTLRTLGSAGVQRVGLAGEAPADIFATDLRGPLAVVLGAEEKGMRRLTRENCDTLARIPMAGQVESLNVSVAAGVCLFEAVRQRR